jgi:16S rRNA (uracil1498-N3)-methyltransferase
VERGDRPPVATFYVDAPLAGGGHAVLGEATAHHARVRRMDPGDDVALTDGRGTLASGMVESIARTTLVVAIGETRVIERPMAIHLLVPIGDRDRMLWLAEKATELGITSWRAVAFHRSLSVSPRGSGEAFAAKVRARMISALEQSGGAWLPEVRGDVELADAASLDDAQEGDAAGDRLLLDREGTPILSRLPEGVARVIFGPEGGVAPDEREVLIGHGWRSVTLGPATLRFETAGVGAVAVLRAARLSREEN